MLESEEPRHPDATNAPEDASATSESGVSRLAALSNRIWQRRYRMAGAAGVVTVLGAAALVSGQLATTTAPTVAQNSQGPAGGSRLAGGPGLLLAASPRGGTSGGLAQRGLASGDLASHGSTPGGGPLPGGSTSSGLAPSGQASAAPPGGAASGARPSALPSQQDPADAIVTVTTTGEIATDHHMLRVASARADLTAQRELAWVADGGYPVGDARCSQDFRFRPGTPAGVRRTMLICWRTSAAKSVYTIAVDVDKPPVATASVAAIDKTWAAMG